MATGQLFSRTTQALIYNYNQKLIEHMLEFDTLCGRETPSVAGVIHPGSEGSLKLLFGSKQIEIPVHSTIEAACAAHPTADVFINYASSGRAAASSKAALKQPRIRVVAINAESVPELEIKQMIAYACSQNKVLIGPAFVGVIQAGAFKIGDTAGTIDNIFRCKLYKPGSVGFVSNMGGMSNEIYNTIARVTDGTYEGIVIGRDVITGSTITDHVLRFNNIPQVKMIVVLEELGGRDDYSLVKALKNGKLTKPVVAWVSACARLFKSEVQFGHLEAKSDGEMKFAQEKNQALREAGAIVPTSDEALEAVIKETYDKLALEGKITPVKEVTSPKISVNTIGTFFLLKAAIVGDLPALRGLVEVLKVTKEIQNLVDKYGRNPLHLAATSPNFNCLKYLVEELQVNINCQDRFGWTPLHHAIECERYASAAYLLQHSANPYATTRDNQTTLHIASKIGSTDLIKLLLLEGVDINSISDYGTPLFLALKHGHDDCVTLLLESKANPNIFAHGVFSPLIAAIRNGAIECVNMLLEAKVDPNETTPEGVMPLELAAQNGCTKIIEYLLKAGADPNVCGLFKCTPVEVAAIMKKTEAVKVLFEKTYNQTIPEWSVDGLLERYCSDHNRYKIHNAHHLKAVAKVAMQSNEYQKAVYLYSQAISIDPGDEDSLSYRSVCYLALKREGLALEDALTCIKLEPDSVEGLYLVGRAWSSLNDYGRAADAYFKALMLLQYENKTIEKKFWAALKRSEGQAAPRSELTYSVNDRGNGRGELIEWQPRVRFDNP